MPPNAGICQLLTGYFTRVPDFCESLRVLNLSGQYVLTRDVARLFSKQNPLRFPSLKSMTLRLTCDRETINHCIDPPSHLEHFEVCVEQCLCRQVSETILPLLRKVKHLAWYRGDAYGPTFPLMFTEPLQSLETLETPCYLLENFGFDPMKVMPSLKYLIVHEPKSIVSVAIKQFLEDGGEAPRGFNSEWTTDSPYVELFCRDKVNINFRFVPDGYEHLRGKREIREVTLGFGWQMPVHGQLVDSVLPLMSSFANLEKVTILKSFLLSWHGDRRLTDHLWERFQFPSVRELRFAIPVDGTDEDEDPGGYVMDKTELDSKLKDPCDRLLCMFLRMFPNLDTFIIPDLRTSPDELVCPQLESASLPRLRKLILFFDYIHKTTRARFNRPHLWENVETLVIDIMKFERWPAWLRPQLKKHMNLRHLCIVAEVEGFEEEARLRLSIKKDLQDLAEAWRGRNWHTIIYIIRARNNLKVTVFSAERNGDGSIKYQEMHRQSCSILLSTFPQFYALFWQYIGPRSFEHDFLDYM